MAQVFEWIYVVFAVLLLFGAAIAIHEWGHYWVALKRGLKVEAFAIGFGPKIWGWTKDGIKYSIRWIPAGGHVKRRRCSPPRRWRASRRANNSHPFHLGRRFS